MPEFIVPPKYKQLFNEYDLSVIKADHYVAEREDLRLYRNTFLERIKQRYRAWADSGLTGLSIRFRGPSPNPEVISLMAEAAGLVSASGHRA